MLRKPEDARGCVGRRLDSAPRRGSDEGTPSTKLSRRTMFIKQKKKQKTKSLISSPFLRLRHDVLKPFVLA